MPKPSGHLVIEDMAFKTNIEIDWPPTPKVRYGYGVPPHNGLLSAMPNAEKLLNVIASMGTLECLHDVPIDKKDEITPFWNNGWLPMLDALSLMHYVTCQKPQMYCEIGSGNSTKFVKYAIDYFELDTRIISIDPSPRAEIDTIVDEVIRERLEEVDTAILGQLGETDILFFDGSHRCFQNSDVNVFFLEVLPSLNPDVLIGIHDIFLPRDYPPAWLERYYNEQYLLGVYLLCEKAEVIFPANYVAHNYQNELMNNLSDKIGKTPKLLEKGIGGTSFWFKKKS